MPASLVGAVCTVKQSTAGTAATGTVGAGGVASGDLSIIRGYCNLGTGAIDALVTTDSKGNTYQTDLLSTSSGSTLFVASGPASVALLNGDTYTIKANLVGAAQSVILIALIEEWAGMNVTGTRVEGSVVVQTASAQGTAFDSGPITTVLGSQAIIGALGANNATASITTETDPWIAGPTPRDNTSPTVRDIYSWYKIQSAAETHELRGTMSSSSANIAGIVTYLAADAVPTTSGSGPPVGAACT